MMFTRDFCSSATAQARLVTSGITGFMPPACYTSIGVTAGLGAQKALFSGYR